MRSTATPSTRSSETYPVNLGEPDQRDDRRRPGRRDDHRRRRRARRSSINDVTVDRRATAARSTPMFTVGTHGPPAGSRSASAAPRPTAPRRRRPTTRRDGNASCSAGRDTTQTLTVPVNGDVLDEIDETFTVEPVRTPSTRTIADGQRRRHDHRRRRAAGAVGQRRDGDRGQHRHGRRRLHGHAGRPPAARPSPSTTRPPTAPPSRRPTTQATSGTLTFAPGETSKTRHGAGHRRRARRDRRDVQRRTSPARPTRRSPTPGHRHDHRRRRRHPRSRSAT